MSKEKIYLSKSGYEQFMKELQELRDILNNNGKMKSEAFESAVGDGWHDNFAFEEAKREELRLQGLLEKKLEELKRIEIIDEVENEDLIKVDDYVSLQMAYAEDDVENMIIKLVGSNTPNFGGSIQEISLNSPLGKAIYEKRVGDQVSYKVNEVLINVLINNKSENINDLIDTPKEKRI